jgi:hypothetical protein
VLRASVLELLFDHGHNVNRTDGHLGSAPPGGAVEHLGDGRHRKLLTKRGHQAAVELATPIAQSAFSFARIGAARSGLDCRGL